MSLGFVHVADCYKMTSWWYDLQLEDRYHNSSDATCYWSHSPIQHGIIIIKGMQLISVLHAKFLVLLGVDNGGDFSWFLKKSNHPVILHSVRKNYVHWFAESNFPWFDLLIAAVVYLICQDDLSSDVCLVDILWSWRQFNLFKHASQEG